MIRGWKFWVEGGINPATNQEERGRMIYLPEEAKVDPHTKPKFFWGFVVYNYKYEMIQIMEIISTQIKEPLMGYFHDPQWGDPRGYDIVISREGIGLKTRSQMRPGPNKKGQDMSLYFFGMVVRRCILNGRRRWHRLSFET